jgi:hypothetical protein
MKDTTFASCITPPAIPPYITAQEGPDACGAQGDTTAHLCGPYYLPPFNCSQLLLCTGEVMPPQQGGGDGVVPKQGGGAGTGQQGGGAGGAPQEGAGQGTSRQGSGDTPPQGGGGEGGTPQQGGGEGGVPQEGGGTQVAGDGGRKLLGDNWANYK